MNDLHLKFLASPEWARMLESELLPWIERRAPLGDDVLEVGPGPGLTTDLLRALTPKLTAVEIDPDLAERLASRLQGTNVEVMVGDATDIGLESNRFSAATCFAMLHHVPSAELQDRVFAELHCVLRPGGVLLAVDSLDLEAIRMFHEGDMFVPVDHALLGARLEQFGFRDAVVETTQFEFRVHAFKR